jgi:ribosomal protein S14
MTTLRIDPPLPCGVLSPTDPARRCGRPATVAQADPTGSGQWILLPICRACVRAVAASYGVSTPETVPDEPGGEPS